MGGFRGSGALREHFLAGRDPRRELAAFGVRGGRGERRDRQARRQHARDRNGEQHDEQNERAGSLIGTHGIDEIVHPGQTIEGLLEGSNATVELVGRGGGNFEMTIPVELASEAGTAVILPGVHSQIIALVDAVISSPTDPVKKVILHSPVNIQGLKWVQVKK